MTKITGIVVEDYPFHNDPLRHLQQAKEITQCDVLVAVMAGHFNQRGEPTIIDKWRRTAAVLDAGADLVIELPFACTVQNASLFAQGAVTLLHLAGCKELVFASESNDLETLQVMADCPINVDALKENLKRGVGYPRTLGQIQGSYAPHDILGIAYIRAMQEFKIQPICIQITNDNQQEDLIQNFGSASAISNVGLSSKNVTQYAPITLDLNPKTLIHYDLYYPAIRLKLLTTPKDQLNELFMMEEGMENHLVKMAKIHDDFASFITAAISKRYTQARIQRTLAHLLVHTLKSEMKNLPILNTLRILGFNSIGRAHLKTLHKQEIRIASRYNQIPLPFRYLEYRSTLVYASILNNDDRNKLVQREIDGPVIKKD